MKEKNTIYAYSGTKVFFLDASIFISNHYPNSLTLSQKLPWGCYVIGIRKKTNQSLLSFTRLAFSRSAISLWTSFPLLPLFTDITFWTLAFLEHLLVCQFLRLSLINDKKSQNVGQNPTQISLVIKQKQLKQTSTNKFKIILKVY